MHLKVQHRELKYQFFAATFTAKYIITYSEINRTHLMLTCDLNSVLISERESTDTLHLHAP